MDKTTQHRVIHWGKPSSNYREWTTTTVCCHGYANLPTERGTSSKSPEFACLGHRWYLELYPGGDEDSANDYAAIFLWSNEPPGEGGGGSSRMYIDFAFAVRDDGGGGTGGGESSRIYCTVRTMAISTSVSGGTSLVNRGSWTRGSMVRWSSRYA